MANLKAAFRNKENLSSHCNIERASNHLVVDIKRASSVVAKETKISKVALHSFEGMPLLSRP